MNTQNPRYLRDAEILRQLRAHDAQCQQDGFTGPLILQIHYKNGDPGKLKAITETTYDLLAKVQVEQAS